MGHVKDSFYPDRSPLQARIALRYFFLSLNTFTPWTLAYLSGDSFKPALVPSLMSPGGGIVPGHRKYPGAGLLPRHHKLILDKQT